MRHLLSAAVLVLVWAIPSRSDAQLDPSFQRCWGDFERLGLPCGKPAPWTSSAPPAPGPGGSPTAWEGGPYGDGQGESGLLSRTAPDPRGRSVRLSDKVSAEPAHPAPCLYGAVSLDTDQGPAGLLTFTSQDCPSPLQDHEIWSWSAHNLWPAQFEIRSDAPVQPIDGPSRSWAFPNIPFALDDAGPWLQDIDPLPEDHLYEVERFSENDAEVIAWFWFKADLTWTQTAYADASLSELYLSLRPGEVLRFTEIDAADLPVWVQVVQAGD